MCGRKAASGLAASTWQQVALPPLGPLAARAARVIVDALPEIKADPPAGRAREFHVTTSTALIPGGAGWHIEHRQPVAVIASLHHRPPNRSALPQQAHQSPAKGVRAAS